MRRISLHMRRAVNKKTENLTRLYRPRFAWRCSGRGRPCHRRRIARCSRSVSALLATSWRRIAQVAVPGLSRCAMANGDRSAPWRVTVAQRHAAVASSRSAEQPPTDAKCRSRHARRRRPASRLVSAGARRSNSARSRRHATRPSRALACR